MNKLHKQVFEWSKKYGPVVTVRAGNYLLNYLHILI